MIGRAFVVLGSLSVALLAGCVPQERLDASCEWKEGASALAAPGTRARRSHLVADARLAQELGVRYADSAIGRPPPVMSDWDHAARRCVDASLTAAVRGHAADHVTRAELDAVVGAPDWWSDAFAVFLPVGVLWALLSRVIAARVVAGNAPTEWAPAALTLAVLTPAVAAIALGLTIEWAWFAEAFRLHDNHISFRGEQLAPNRHKWPVASAAGAVFAIAALAEVRRARRVAAIAPGARHRGPVGTVSLGIGRSSRR